MNAKQRRAERRGSGARRQRDARAALGQMRSIVSEWSLGRRSPSSALAIIEDILERYADSKEKHDAFQG